MRRLGLAMVGLMMAGCASFGSDAYPAPDWLHLGPHPYVVGDYRVMVVPVDLAPSICRRYGVEARHGRLRGCQIEKVKPPILVIGVANQDEAAGALLCIHEFRHTVDGNWHP